MIVVWVQAVEWVRWIVSSTWWASSAVEEIYYSTDAVNRREDETYPKGDGFGPPKPGLKGG